MLLFFMNKLQTLRAGISILGCVVGCGWFVGPRPYTSGRSQSIHYNRGYNGSRTRPGNETPGYSGSSYGVVRDRHGRVIQRRGSVWRNSSPRHRRRIGLPSNPTPENIRRKFRRDVEILRRRRR